MKNTAEQMIGSEKQVAWATQIKASWIAELDKMVGEASERVANGSMPASWLSIVTEVANKANDVLNTWTAARIIETRNYPMRSNAEKAARAQYAALEAK